METTEIKAILKAHQMEYHEEGSQIIVHDHFLNCNTTPGTPGTDYVNVTDYTKEKLYEFLGY